jgi:hypothetical protein
MDTDVTFCFSLQKTIAFLKFVCEFFFPAAKQRFTKINVSSGGEYTYPCCKLVSLRGIFLIGIVGGGESNWVHSALRPSIGLFYQPRVIMMMEKFME